MMTSEEKRKYKFGIFLKADQDALIARLKAVKKARKTPQHKRMIKLTLEQYQSVYDDLFTARLQMRDRLRAIHLLRAMMAGKNYSELECKADFEHFKCYVRPYMVSLLERYGARVCVPGRSITVETAITLWMQGSEVELTYS